MLIAKGRSRMDQKKIGFFLKELRKKRNHTGTVGGKLVAVMVFAFMMNIYNNIGCVPLYNIYAVTVLTFEGADAQKILIYLTASRRLLKA